MPRDAGDAATGTAAQAPTRVAIVRALLAMSLSLHPLDADDLRRLLAGPESFEAKHGWRIEPGALPPQRVLECALEHVRAAPRWAHLTGTHLYLLDGELVVGAGGVKAPPGPALQVEIGYGVAPAFHGCGIGTEGARQLLAACFASGVQAVLADTRPDNLPSQRLLQRLGFVRAGVADDPEEGPVWRWCCDADAARAADVRGRSA